jgi:hypothetical protein
MSKVAERTRQKIITTIEDARTRGDGLKTYVHLSLAARLPLSIVMNHVSYLEAKHRLVRDIQGAMQVLPAANDTKWPPPKLTPEQIDEARAASYSNVIPRLRREPRPGTKAYVPPAERLPMPKAQPAPARKLAAVVRERSQEDEAAARRIRDEERQRKAMEEQARAEERASTTRSKMCPRCCDQPWRRRKGEQCRCGGWFEPETVAIILEGQSSIALCE